MSLNLILQLQNYYQNQPSLWNVSLFIDSKWVYNNFLLTKKIPPFS